MSRSILFYHLVYYRLIADCGSLGLKKLEPMGYLLNVTTSMGTMSTTHSDSGPHAWSASGVRNEFNACPDVFPVGGNGSDLFAVLSSLAPSYTNEWWVGELKPGAGHYDQTAFTPLSHGVLDYGGVFAGKTGADVTIDQRQSDRRVLFGTTEDIEHDASGATGSAWAGCGCGTMLLPRELSLGARATAGGEQQPFLRIAPVKEVETLRQGAPMTGVAPVRFKATGSQVEVLVRCDAATEEVTVRLYESDDQTEGVSVSYSRRNATMAVNRTSSNRFPAANPQYTCTQTAPHATTVAFELRLFADGGLLQSFLDESVVITSILNLTVPELGSPPAARGVSVAGGSGCEIQVWRLSLAATSVRANHDDDSDKLSGVTGSPINLTGHFKSDDNAAAAISPWPRCRCLPADPCWEKVDWAALNRSVHGRLEASVDEMQPCMNDINSVSCSHALEGSDDEFWLTSKPNGYQHTGQFGVWNLTNRISSYAVRAETEADFQATVAFAAANDLRLVVKATGHDWYGRSTAGGSLLLWTHLRKEITFTDAFVPTGSTDAGVPAVTVQSGVQFSDLYPACQAQPFPGDPLQRATIVMGGGCDSVGVSGCWLGGCYNVFTKKFGDGATNLMQAKVVLANGSLVSTSETSHPDVFWTLRGGGGGNIAVVTEFTARTHPAPRFTSSSGFWGKAKDLGGFKVLLKRVLKGLAESNHWPLESQCTSGAPRWNVTELEASLGCRHYEGNTTKLAALYAPMVAWCNATAQQQLGIKCGAHASYTWCQTEYQPHSKMWDNASFIPKEWVGNEPWISYHADREISTALVGSLSKYIPMRGCTDDKASDEIVEGVIKIEAILSNMSNTGGGIHVLDGPTGDKSQSGMPPEIVERFKKTSLNPVLLEAPSFWLIMLNIPSLPQLPPSSRLLKSLWPRLKEYAVLSEYDPLWVPCEAGAAGNEAKAKQCMDGWSARVPRLRAQVAEVRKIMWQVFPNLKDGESYSGSYWNEADYEDPSFQISHWGTNYPRLLALKKTHDPQGLFYGHHSVGSELWSADGNCRLPGK